MIVISAHEKFEFAKKSLQLGARDFLIKPVELEELIRVVGKVLGEKKEAGKQTLEHTEWQLYLIGQMIYMNLKQYLKLDAMVGLSTLNSDKSMFPKLLEVAESAIEWCKLHPTKVNVFYYIDMIGQDNINRMQ